MARYLIQQPRLPTGPFGSIDAGDDDLPFVVGEVHEMPAGHGRIESWIVEAVEPSPKAGYDALIVFAVAPHERRDVSDSRAG